MLAARVKRRTLVRYRGIIARHIYPHLDVTANIGDVSKGEIEALLKAAERRNATRNLTITVLKGVFAYAAERGWIAVDPMRAFKQNAVKRKPVEVFTEEEQRTLEAYALRHGDPACAVAMLCLYTGMRYCDMKDLTFANVDRSNRLLRFEQDKTAGHSSSSGVVIPLNDSLLRLIGLPSGQGPMDQKIFRLPSYSTSLKAIKKWVRLAGIDKHISWHCARHSFAVNILNNGANIKTVASLLGHSSLRHTEKYTRAIDSLKQQAIDSLPDLDL